jgi:eukaryotic-like serine/threonine-protein kinase
MPKGRDRDAEPGRQETLPLPLEGPRAVLTPDAPTVTPAIGSTGPEVGQPPPAAPDVPRDPIERAAPRHDLLKLIGKGGMGEVYIAFDPELRRRVAFKRLLAELADNQRLAARFLTEVQVTAQLDHPNIVPINGFELAVDGTLGYSMKLVKGRDLAKLIEKWRGEAGKVSRAKARERLGSRLDIFLRICEAMTYAHGKGVLHRDLKPENVMVGAWNDVYVMDWGLFRLIGDRDDENAVTINPGSAEAGGHGKTLEGSVMGTPGYMSPEQAEGSISKLDERSDVYALGVILHELVSLAPARRGADANATVELARRGVLAPLVSGEPHVPLARELRAIVAKATAVRVEDRYPTAAALAEDVRRHMRGEAVSARPDTPLAAAGRALARHRMAALVTIVVLLLAGAAGVTWLQLARSRAALAAERREAAIKTMSVAAERHADNLDRAFQRWEVLVARLVGHANESLRTPGPSEQDVQVHMAASFDGAPGSPPPPPLTPSRRYGIPISVTWPVVKVAAGVPVDEDIVDEARRAADLRGALSDALLATAQPPAAPEALLGDGVPGLRAFVTLENGVHVSYPGHGGYEASYDGRQRDKYTTTKGDQEGRRGSDVIWGHVYKDRYGLGFVVPAGGGLRNPAGDFIGVAGLEISLDWIAAHLLPIGEPWADACYLLDGDGHVLVSVRAGESPVFHDLAGPSSGEGAPLTFKPFSHAEAEALVTGDASGVITLADGRMAALYPLAAIDWTFVVVTRAGGPLDGQ